MRDEDDTELERWFSTLLERSAGPLRIVGSPWTAVAVLVAFLMAGVLVTWRMFGPEILQHDRYWLSAEMIEISPQPAWIHTDVKAEVVRDGSLDQLKLHDRQICTKIADAFAVHSWVAAVQRVRKTPRTVIVELEYRRPVAMVEVMSNGQPGLVPVDANGVILPTVGISESQTRDSLRIAVADVKSFGIVGTRWEDDRIHQAAVLAGAWAESWVQIRLYRIVVMSNLTSDDSTEELEFELHTKNGTAIRWGRAIGHEKPGEANAAIKIARLLQYVEENGRLDELTEPAQLDLRDGTVKESMPRTADRLVHP